MTEAHSFQQSELFNSALARMGRAPRRIALPSGEAFTLSRFGLSLASRPRDTAETYEALAAQRIHIINAESAHPALPQNGYRQLIKPAHIACLGLSPDPEAQRAAMRPKWRRSLERFEAARPAHIGLSQRAFDPDQDAWLLKAEAAQSRARRYKSYPRKLTETMAEVCPKALRLFTLSEADQPLAAMLFALHGPCATYYIGWSGPEGRRLGAHWLLLWRAMQDLPIRRITTLDLGLIETEHSADLARFKLGSGAEVRALGGTWARLF